MKRFARLLALCMIVLTLTSCMDTGQFLELALCGAYAVPGTYSSDTKGGTLSTEVLEEDSYGRVLFAYTAKNVISGNKETWLVICQKITNEHVYFYEDQCYIMDNISDSEMDTFKNRNDWQKDLDESKMSRRQNKISVDLYIRRDSYLSISDVRNACISKLGVPREKITNCECLDSDPNGKELFYLSVEAYGGETAYLVIAGTDYQVSLFRIGNSQVTAEEVAAFKHANGWTYGFDFQK